MKLSQARIKTWGSRKKAAIIAAVLALALALTGTFAWYANAGVMNVFSNTGEITSDNKDVVLHDDFAGGPVKEVYVENTGDVDLYIRVKLSEYLDLTSATNRESSEIDWVRHLPDPAVNDCDLTNASSDYFHDNFTWSMGGWKWYMPAEGGGSGYVQDTTVYNSESPGVKQTPNATVITMAAYTQMTDLQKKSFIGWVYDADGWAYWSQKLPSGEATGLLLARVDAATGLENTDYFYAIDVFMEAVDEDDLPMWTVPSGNSDGLGQPSVESSEQTEEATSGAKDLLNSLTPEKPVEATLTAIEITRQPNKLIYTEDETFNPAGMEVQATYSDGSTAYITGYSNSVNGTWAEGTVEITVTYNGKSDSLKVTVLPLGPLGGLSNVTNGSEVQIDNTWWIKIGDYNDGTHKYALLVLKANVFTQNDFTFGSTSNYETSSLKVRMSTFYADEVKYMNTLKNAIVMPDISTENSIPTSVLAKDANLGMIHNAVFALSKTEASSFAHNTTAKWWTRTAAAESGNSVWVSDSAGTNGWSLYPVSNKGVNARPAIWVMCS